MGRADPAAGAASLGIEVVYCPAPGQVDRTRLLLPAGSTLADALHASGVLARHGMDAQSLPPLGVWCKPAAPDSPLRDRDRVEVYRPLAVDPKEARRQRYRRGR